VSKARVFSILAAVAAVFAAALWLRFRVVEPRGAELMCTLAGAPGWCSLRKALVPVFTFQGFGVLSLLCGLFAAWKHRPAWGVPAVLLGSAGMVLYNVELASVGLILGLIALTRKAARPAHCR